MKKLTERELYERHWMRRVKTDTPPQREGKGYYYASADDGWAAWQASARVKRSRSKSGGGL